uniref:Uncharacterized protein n=1 Tax=Musa acuminata subsp. malaccensis TaxID=214687 RepID=A0A804JD72_MUSAM
MRILQLHFNHPESWIDFVCSFLLYELKL